MCKRRQQPARTSATQRLDRDKLGGEPCNSAVEPPLGGRACEPEVNKLLANVDAVPRRSLTAWKRADLYE
jgi:hypothetical protein